MKSPKVQYAAGFLMTDKTGGPLPVSELKAGLLTAINEVCIEFELVLSKLQVTKVPAEGAQKGKNA